MSILDITHNHGQEMYIIGLEYAIAMINILGPEALPRLEQRIKEVKDELIDEPEDCEHEDTHTEDIENTAEYELNQAQGNTSAPLTHNKIEVCNFCGKQRDLPEGEWNE